MPVINTTSTLSNLVVCFFRAINSILSLRLSLTYCNKMFFFNDNSSEFCILVDCLLGGHVDRLLEPELNWFQKCPWCTNCKVRGNLKEARFSKQQNKA